MKREKDLSRKMIGVSNATHKILKLEATKMDLPIIGLVDLLVAEFIKEKSPSQIGCNGLKNVPLR